MARITVEIRESTAELLKEKAQRYGLPPEQFLTASIEYLIAQPEHDFEEAMRRVLLKNKDLYERLT